MSGLGYKLIKEQEKNAAISDSSSPSILINRAEDGFF